MKLQNAVQSCFYMASYFQNILDRQPMVWPSGWDIGFFFFAFKSWSIIIYEYSCALCKLHTQWTCIICSLQNIPLDNFGHHEMCLKDLHILSLIHLFTGALMQVSYCLYMTLAHQLHEYEIWLVFIVKYKEWQMCGFFCSIICIAIIEKKNKSVYYKS